MGGISAQGWRPTLPDRMVLREAEAEDQGLIKESDMYLRYATYAVYAFIIASTTFAATVVYRDITRKVEPPRPLEVYCIDGSKWHKVTVNYVASSYDLFKDTKWIARVPANACSLLPSE